MKEEDFLVINNEVTIKNGMILANPFFEDFTNIEMANYLFGGNVKGGLITGNNANADNRHKIENKIKRKIHNVIKEGDYGISLDLESDCYEYVIDYFLSRKNLFKKNYFGEGTDYSLEKYLFSNIKYAVLEYKSKLEKKGDALIYSKRILDNNESENGSFGVSDNNIIDESTFTEDSHGIFSGKTTKNYKVVYNYIDKLLVDNNYITDNLNIEGIIYYFFLVYYPTDEEKYEQITKNCKVDSKFIDIFLEDLQKVYVDGSQESLEFRESLRALIDSNNI